MLSTKTLQSLADSRMYILTNKFIPTDYNINILNKGPTFIPKTKPDIKKIRFNINDFLRKLQWHMFLNNDNDGNKNRFGYNKSKKWCTGKQISPDTNKLCDTIKKSCYRIINKHHSIHDNYISDFNPNLLYLVADKGSNWVICDKNNYLEEGARQLGNTTFYNHIERERARYNQANINRFVNYLYDKKRINYSEKCFLTCSTDYRKRQLNLIPKIHKDNWTFPNYFPPARPIIDNHKSEAHNISVYIDFYLQPIVRRIPSFIRDSFHFQVIMPSIIITESSSLLTCDIESLYTNIPIDGAINAIKIMFQRFPDATRPDDVIIKLIHLILSNNDFSFNNNLYLQCQGVSMGQRFSPSVANIYLALWEEKLFSNSGKKPSCWYRYIDDIFAIWPHSTSDIPSFIHFANSIDNNIKLTYSHSHDHITFLDLSLYKFHNSLKSRIHFKPSNSHAIIHRHSNHPRHTFNGIIYSLIYRWVALNSTYEDYKKTTKQPYRVWETRGYTRTMIRNTEKKVIKNLNLNQNWTHGFEKCDNCTICHYTTNNTSFTVNYKTFKIIGHYSCHSQNVIYLIKCNKCNIHYIGQTQSFYHRIMQHINAIKRHQTGILYSHFVLCGLNNFNCFVIDHNNCKDVTKKEITWINKLKTFTPFGLNIVAKKNFIPRVVLPYNNLSQKIGYKIKNICKFNNIDINITYSTEANLKSQLKLQHIRTQTQT